MRTTEKEAFLTHTEFDSSMVKLFASIEKRFDEQDKKFDKLLSAVDAYAKQVEIYHQESIARDGRVDRLQGWVEQIAKKTGVKLEY